MDVKSFVAAACVAVALANAADAQPTTTARQTPDRKPPHASVNASSDATLGRGYELLFPARPATHAAPTQDSLRPSPHAPLWTVLSGPDTQPEPKTGRLFDTDRPRNLLVALRAGF